MRYCGLVLLQCVGLLFSGGFYLGTSATWSIIRNSHYFWTTDLGVELGSVVLFVAASLLCMPACWLAALVPYHPKSLSLIAILMFLVTAAMLLLSTGLSTMTALSRSLREPDLLNASMMNAMSRESLELPIRRAFASMQLDLKCCGVTSPADWLQYQRYLPPSCCNCWAENNGSAGFTNEKEEYHQCKTPVHNKGCLLPALVELRYLTNFITIFVSILIIIMAVVLIVSSYLLVVAVIERNKARESLHTLRFVSPNSSA